MKIKQENFVNFKTVSAQDLNNIVGGFAIAPIISVVLTSMMAWKLFISDKGSFHVNGIGEAKWEDNNVKNPQVNRVIYYPY